MQRLSTHCYELRVQATSIHILSSEQNKEVLQIFKISVILFMSLLTYYTATDILCNSYIMANKGSGNTTIPSPRAKPEVEGSLYWHYIIVFFKYGSHFNSVFICNDRTARLLVFMPFPTDTLLSSFLAPWEVKILANSGSSNYHYTRDLL